MAFFTPESFDLMLNEIEKKTDEERHETIIMSIPADFTPPIRNRKPLIPEIRKPAFR